MVSRPQEGSHGTTLVLVLCWRGKVPMIIESIEDLSQVNIKISNKKFIDTFPNFSFTSMESGIKKYINELS